MKKKQKIINDKFEKKEKENKDEINSLKKFLNKKKYIENIILEDFKIEIKRLNDEEKDNISKITPPFNENENKIYQNYNSLLINCL
jgi:CRISPR/Cas system-associated exonuclease Cas4 (RecB family)